MAVGLDILPEDISSSSIILPLTAQLFRSSPLQRVHRSRVGHHLSLQGSGKIEVCHLYRKRSIYKCMLFSYALLLLASSLSSMDIHALLDPSEWKLPAIPSNLRAVQMGMVCKMQLKLSQDITLAS